MPIKHKLKEGRTKYFIAALLSVVIWGFFSIPLRLLQDYAPEDILHYRIFTSLIITWLVILFFRKSKLKQDLTYLKSESKTERKRIIWLSILAGFLITSNWFTYIYAVNEVSLKSAAFAYMICPLITAMGGFLILKEKLSTFKLAAIGIAAISIVILAQGSFRELLWSVIVASLYAFYLIIQRVMGRIDKLLMLGIHLVIATVITLPLFLYNFQQLPLDLYFWTVIVIISILFTIVPLFLSLYALIGMPSSTLGIIIYLNPIVAFAVAFFYFHEGIDPHQLYAYSMLFAAVIVFNWNSIKELTIRPAE
ncbi:EamA family transporter [Daejeonella sp.]|uniref:EamA family transporter n=1 Tax=Daejeonella sp. TaxID=2805397 RepID=UPI0039834A92